MMTPLKLTAAKKKWTGFLHRIKRKAICDDPGEQDRLAIAFTRLTESWQEYENTQQDVLGLVTEDEVEKEQVTYISRGDLSRSS